GRPGRNSRSPARCRTARFVAGVAGVGGSAVVVHVLRRPRDLLQQRSRNRPVGGRLPVDLLEYRALGVLALGHGQGLSLQGLRRRGLRQVGDPLVDERRSGDRVERREVGGGQFGGLVLVLEQVVQ